MAVSEWENSCRLCAEQQPEMFSIFGEEGIRRKVAHKLRVCLPVMVYKTDPLPKKICQFCAARLDDVYEFREYCLSVYKSMHRKLLSIKDSKTVEIYMEAMKNSPDPCQVQLCKEKARAPPPLVPLPASLMMTKRLAYDVPLPVQACSEPLTELPCEVEIQEDPTDTELESSLTFEGIASNHREFSNAHSPETRAEDAEENDVIVIDDNFEEDATSDNGTGDKRTSILEQVLTGNLTIKDGKELAPEAKLNSEWWCSPCNSYYRTKGSLMKHMQLFCPRKYTCTKCSMIFKTVQELAKHEATDHLKITFDFEESAKEYRQCDREFVGREMLRHDRICDHTGQSSEIDTATWCPLCNRLFPTVELYYSHKQIHDAEEPALQDESNSQIQTASNETKNEYLVENVRSLTCPTCGKVCTQQSALSNHMRTHEPKKHKCEICGRSFGLFIRLAAHRLSEHGQQPIMSPITASVEQEEALNAEREAREARVARKPKSRIRKYSEIANDDEVTSNDLPSLERKTDDNVNESKNVARCGICQQWFTDHTTMLTHLQTHSDNLSSKSFTCRSCNKTFKEKWQLNRHEVSHKRKIGHTCNICNKTFADSNQLKNHKTIHTLNKTYHCPKCNKIFFKEFSLMTHRCTEASSYVKRNATSVKTARNKISSVNNNSRGANKKVKNFKDRGTSSSLKSKRSHTRLSSEENKKAPSETSFVLDSNKDTMPKLSPVNSPGTSSIEPKVEIKEDENIPTPVKRTLIRTAGGYRCGVCQSPFVLRELAVAHLRSAHPMMPFQCPYCKKCFTTQYTFTHHIKADHPDESEK